MSKKNGKRPDLDIPVEFGGVGIGQTTARLGLRISRNDLNIVAADETFCGHRLKGKVTLGQRDDAKGQGKMFDSDIEVEDTFDVKRIGVTPGDITTGLTFNLSDVDISELAKFSKGTGKLCVYEVGEIPEDAPDEHDEDAEPKKRKSLAVPDGKDWKGVKIDTLFAGKTAQALSDAGIKTVFALAKFIVAKKKLAELDGIGPGSADKIVNTMIDFYADNPQATEEMNSLAE